MIRSKQLALALSSFVVAVCGVAPVSAVENTWDYAVQVSSTVQASPARITLTWPQDTNGTPSSYTIYRKAPGASSWGGAIATLSGSATSYADASVTAGAAYEYRIVKATGGYAGYGYIQTGITAPLVDQRGKVILLVDNTMAGPLAAELQRLEQDLAGDGWTVVRRDVARTDSPANVRALVRGIYDADRANVKSLFLFGHVPVPYSGQLNPDGHTDHIGAWPADVYYADVDGTWTDTTVNYVQTTHRYAFDNARSTNVPGDGKFDQSQIPSAVELELGRVDLANQPGDDYWGIDAVIPSETELLRRYLNKDHAFRHREVNPARRALVGDYLGVLGGGAPAASAFRSFAPLVGANNVRNHTREFNGQEGIWIPETSANDYLFVGGFAYSSYAAIHSLGSAGPALAAPLHEFISRDVRGVFTLMFGSWHGDWDHPDTVLKAPLMTNHGLVSVWSGRPHWFFHPMGQGETAGYVAKLTQNNTGLYETQHNSSANQIHIALMGDPTLRLHPVGPVRSLSGSASGSTVALTWLASSDSDIVGYHVYRGASAGGPFTRLTSAPITALNFTDSAGSTSAVYQVRAIKLETTPSGSYHNQSQGVFWPNSGATTGGGTSGPAPTSDTTSPAISFGAPANGATISGTAVTIAADAFDNVGVAGVQFKVDGANLGAEDTASPFSTTLNTTTLSNGAHTLSAAARDAAGNLSTATISVTVGNGTSTDSGGSTTSTTSPTSAAGDVVWFDDALPAGASGTGTGGDGWNWISAGPTPVSGSKAHQSNIAAGLHEHSFGWGESLSLAAGDKLVTYVYLDPANMPTEIMLSWKSDSWEHRAFWGADKILYGTRGTASRYYAGPLPAPGSWVRLEVPASAVGLEGQTVTMMAFSQFDGRATWDKTAKNNGSVTTTPTTEPPAPTTTDTTTTTTTPTTTTTTSSDTVWFDDALPAGASGSGAGGDGWNWISASPAPFSGTKAHQSSLSTGLHEHSFGWGEGLTLGAGDKLFTYVYLDPANVPSEIMLSWKSDTWEHRAYWGADRISYGTNGTASRYYAGPLPVSGQWVRLEIPASAVGLEGQTVTMMGFSQFDGRATWDKTGKASAGSATTNTSTTTTTTPTTTTTTPPTTTTTVDTFVWLDDALPEGATGVGVGGDAWNWVTAAPAPFSGTRAHQSALAAGLHEHYFAWGATMAVNAGDKLYTYVYLDPANPPTEIMLSWNSDNWEHRAYWGGDRISLGTNGTASRYRVGALPPAGQWVRLEVPASAVGLEGHTVSAMSFGTYDGRVTFDKTGK